MEIILYIAALITAIAFAVLVGYLAITLKATQRTLDNVASTVESLEKQMEGITTETTALLNKTNKLAEDMHDKSTKLNGLFDGIKGIGETVNDFNMSLRQISTHITTAASEDKDKAAQAVKWGAALIDLWKKRKN
ncbi:MAG TPA: DUF948 domain-containing protein [Virgibacillus sp.]|nr:DUF948 domain-containing protein [Virgibacillus sp.]